MMRSEKYKTTIAFMVLLTRAQRDAIEDITFTGPSKLQAIKRLIDAGINASKVENK